MKTLLVSLLALSLATLTVSAAVADWFYDFESPPDGLLFEWDPALSETFSPATNGYLRLFDPVPQQSGGTQDASAYNEEVFTDVRVSAVINAIGDDTRVHEQRVFAMSQGSGEAYWASFFNTSDSAWPSGYLAIGKGDIFFEATDSKVTDFYSPYLLQLDVVTERDPISNQELVNIDAGLFDETGTTQLLSLGVTDRGQFSGTEPYWSGYAGVFAGVGRNDDVSLDASFDVVSAVSIPSNTCDVVDLDSMFGVGDIFTGVSVPPADPVFDLNRDDVVNTQDVEQWLSDAATYNGFASPYLKGDTNLDGDVNAVDLNSLALNWQQQSGAVWSGGDFTGEGAVTAADLNAIGLNWLNSIPLAAAIPEPTTATLTLLWLVLFGVWRRRNV